MTSPQPIANHRPPPASTRHENRPQVLRLNFEEGQLRKRIHLFEEIANGHGRDARDSEGADGLRCRQPRVISPDQKRWTQLDITNDESGNNRKDVSRQRIGQQTIHGGFKRTPATPPPKPAITQRRKTTEIKGLAIHVAPNPVDRDPVVPKAAVSQRRKTTEVKVSAITPSTVNDAPALSTPVAPPRRKTERTAPASAVNGNLAVPMTRDRLSGGSNREKRDENVRNSVLALVSAFENGNSSVNAVMERESKMLSVPECAQAAQTAQGQHRKSRVRGKSESKWSAHDTSAQELKPPVLDKRVSRSMESLVQEFEDVAFELSSDSDRTNSEGSDTTFTAEAPGKPERTFEQDIYNQSKLQQVNQGDKEEGRRKLSISRIGQPQQDFEESAPEKRKVLQPKQRPPSTDVSKKSKELSRTFSADVDDIMFGYDHAGNYVPENNCSRNCNHNMESEESHDLEFFASSPKLKNCYETVVVENNNQTSFLDVLKSPMSRRPKLTSPPPTPTVVVITNPPTSPPPKLPTPQPQIAIPPPPSQTDSRKTNGFVNGNITQENQRKLLLLPAPLDLSGSFSPETQRRLTDSALSLSPRRRRRDGTMAPALTGEYAQPINIKRSASAENLATMRPAPIIDGEGYSVPGSHLWSPKASTMKPKSSARLVIEQRPHSNTVPQPILRRRGAPPNSTDQHGVGRSRDKSRRQRLQDELAASTRGEGGSGLDGKKEGFRQRSKLMTMRRKINDAFRRKHHQQKTEEDRISVTSEGSDTEVNEQVLKKRLTYVRAMRLRSSVYCTMQPRFATQYSKLYEYAVIVSLQMNEETRRYEPYEVKRFPHEVSDSQTDKLRAIPQFCFPDAFKWAPVDQYQSESFCFVLTSSDGSRVYGYNRRILPPGHGPRLPEVVCVMSPIGCYPIYNQLLDEIEVRRKHSMASVENLLKLSYECPFPRPGSHTTVVTPAPSNKKKHLSHLIHDYKPLSLQRPQDQRLEHVDFDTLFNCLSVNRIVQIFASLLFERRVIMCSGKLSKLSRCSQALAGLLYPFSWQHVYVPVLPEKLIDMCCSPTPYIMGMLSLCIPRLEEMPLEEVLVVDLDGRDFYTVIGDEDSILPKKLTSALERALKVCSMSSWEGADTDDELSEDHEAKNSAISEAFIRFFVETVGHYAYHFTPTYDGSQKFDREGFVKAVSSKSVRAFLEVFSETQMFSLFIQEKEAESEGISQGLFEKRVKEFESESKSNTKNISAKMKKIGKAVKDIKDSGLKRMKQNLDDKI